MLDALGGAGGDREAWMFSASAGASGMAPAFRYRQRRLEDDQVRNLAELFGERREGLLAAHRAGLPEDASSSIL